MAQLRASARLQTRRIDQFRQAVDQRTDSSEDDVVDPQLDSFARELEEQLLASPQKTPPSSSGLRRSNRHGTRSSDPSAPLLRHAWMATEVTSHTQNVRIPSPAVRTDASRAKSTSVSSYSPFPRPHLHTGSPIRNSSKAAQGLNRPVRVSSLSYEERQALELGLAPDTNVAAKAQQWRGAAKKGRRALPTPQFGSGSNTPSSAHAQSPQPSTPPLDIQPSAASTQQDLASGMPTPESTQSEELISSKSLEATIPRAQSASTPADVAIDVHSEMTGFDKSSAGSAIAAKHRLEHEATSPPITSGIKRKASQLATRVRKRLNQESLVNDHPIDHQLSSEAPSLTEPLGSLIEMTPLEDGAGAPVTLDAAALLPALDRRSSHYRSLPPPIRPASIDVRKSAKRVPQPGRRVSASITKVPRLRGPRSAILPSLDTVSQAESPRFDAAMSPRTSSDSPMPSTSSAAAEESPVGVGDSGCSESLAGNLSASSGDPSHQDERINMLNTRVSRLVSPVAAERPSHRETALSSGPGSLRLAATSFPSNAHPSNWAGLSGRPSQQFSAPVPRQSNREDLSASPSPPPLVEGVVSLDPYSRASILSTSRLRAAIRAQSDALRDTYDTLRAEMLRLRVDAHVLSDAQDIVDERLKFLKERMGRRLRKRHLEKVQAEEQRVEMASELARRRVIASASGVSLAKEPSVSNRAKSRRAANKQAQQAPISDGWSIDADGLPVRTEGDDDRIDTLAQQQPSASRDGVREDSMLNMDPSFRDVLDPALFDRIMESLSSPFATASGPQSYGPPHGDDPFAPSAGTTLNDMGINGQEFGAEGANDQSVHDWPQGQPDYALGRNETLLGSTWNDEATQKLGFDLDALLGMDILGGDQAL